MRIILSFLLFAVFSATGFAQLQLGLRASYGFSDIRTDSELDAISDQFSNASSLSFGLIAELPITSALSLRSGLEINRRGTTAELGQDAQIFGASIPFGAEAKTRFTYVDVPVLAQYNLPVGGGALTPYVFAGPSFGVATQGNIRTTATALISFNLMTTDIDLDEIDYERMHVAAVGGLGLKLGLGDQLIAFAEGRYEQSLSQPYDVPVLDAKTGFKGFQFGAGFMFKL